MIDIPGKTARDVDQRLTVIVVPETDETFPDLIQASQSSLDFWNNPLDDDDWNDA